MKMSALIVEFSPLKHAGIAKALAATCKLLLLMCATTVAQAQPATNFVTGALWREIWFNAKSAVQPQRTQRTQREAETSEKENYQLAGESMVFLELPSL